MIVLDENGAVADWIREQNLDVAGITRIDLNTFELAKGLETELVIVEDIIYIQMSSVLKEKLNHVSAVILFSISDIEITNYISSIIFELNPKTPRTLLINQIGFLENQIRKESIIKSQMITLNNELNQLMGGVESQLKKVKKTYQRTVPKRMDNFKGLTVVSKYATGESDGGEFFDLFEADNKIFLMMSACSSYLASSSIIQFFSEMKNKNIINESVELIFFSQLFDEINRINSSRLNPVNVELMTVIFDTTTLVLSGYKFGGFSIVSTDLGKELSSENTNLSMPELSRFSLQLSRGERLMLNSSGFQKNWNVARAPFMLEEVISNRKISALDILDEVYFNLKRKSTASGFLNFDASSVIMEVKPNVILQV